MARKNLDLLSVNDVPLYSKEMSTFLKRVWDQFCISSSNEKQPTVIK